MVPKINHLFISKVRVKLLQTFFTHPDEIFYVRELVRKTEEEINAVRRELAHMEKCDMVHKESRANRLYYWFRKDYPYYNELNNMVLKSIGLGHDIITQKNKLGKLNFVIFSGKFAKHQIKEKEDQIDILIVGQVVLPEIAALIQAEEARRKQEINYTVMTDQELQTRKSGRDPFLLSIFSQSRVMIIGDEEKLLKTH